MKTPRLFPLVLLALAWPAQAVPMTDAPTHDQLSQRLRTQQQNDPMAGLQASQGGDPAKEKQPDDLVATSEFLTFGGVSTLVPKAAVLAVPDRLRSRMTYQAGTVIVPWAEFIVNNRGWLAGTEVTMEQAMGKVPFSVALAEQLQKSDKIMIATLQGGPISVIPATPAEEPAAAEAR